MINFFFDRNSKMVVLMDLLGLLLTIIFLFTKYSVVLSGASKVAFWIYIALYLFIRICALIRWHKDSVKGEGVEQQFARAMVPTAYALTINGFCLLAFKTALMIYVSVFVLALVAHVNIILIYLFFKDTDKRPANYFSHNKHLSNG